MQWKVKLISTDCYINNVHFNESNLVHKYIWIIKDLLFYRVAEKIVLSIKSENTVRMNNPFSKSRLREMYFELGNQWPKIKKHMKSNENNSKIVQSFIKVQYFLIKWLLANRLCWPS